MSFGSVFRPRFAEKRKIPDGPLGLPTFFDITINFTPIVIRMSSVLEFCCFRSFLPTLSVEVLKLANTAKKGKENRNVATTMLLEVQFIRPLGTLSCK